MADDTLETEYLEFMSDLRARASETGDSPENAFFETYAALASENGDCPDLEPCRIVLEGRGGYRIDGCAFDQDRGVYYVAICDVRGEDSLETLNAAQLDSLTARARRFVEQLIDPGFAAQLGEGSPEDMAGGVLVGQPALLKRVQILVFSNARLSTRKPPELSGEIGGRPVVCNVLDFGRYAAIARSQGAVEPIEVNLAALAGSPVPCLPAFTEGGGYQSYLIALPGQVLAGIYGLYGPRLLEQNVRTFLQARTKVNKGIIATLRETPEMFFAYNNGLTATASAVRTERLSDGTLGITTIEDLQIVNGGQTTASLLHARDQGASLDVVFVQMKLSVVEPQLIEEVVPRISRYANTQNRISEADFFSGHPFHVTLEQISRRLAPPPRAGALTGEKWFYERSRGQYRDSRARGTPSERRRFETEFPKAQLIEKTDLAKYELTFAARPHIVCLGAQKCFLAFAEHIATEWEAAPLSFNDGWFRAAAARALIFRWTDRMILGSDWYRSDRGHKSQTVAYTLAWLQHHLRKLGKAGLNLQLVWNQQDVTEELRAVIEALAPQVAQTLRDAPEHVRNVGEFAKQQACWALIARTEFDIPKLPEAILLDREVQKEIAREEVAVRRIDVDIEMDRLMVALAGRVDELTLFARKKGLLSPKSDAALRRLGRSQFALSPSERNALRHLFVRLAEEGFPMSATDTPATSESGRERRIQLTGTGRRQVRL
ncbi:AIPR family protein [Sphingomonas sp. MMS24-J45]|uniref:AIPR family protein n=1 Tax=Sphingomonas sp. MMS24-J45 TaxID=3238806 RepID=UPI00384C39C6